MTTAQHRQQPAGALLRQWRERHHLNQSDVAPLVIPCPILLCRA